MRGVNTIAQKRQYKSSEIETSVNPTITDNPGSRSPKASPRRTPKKRKNRASFRLPVCKRILDLPTPTPVLDLNVISQSSEVSESKEEDSKTEQSITIIKEPENGADIACTIDISKLIINETSCKQKEVSPSDAQNTSANTEEKEVNLNKIVESVKTEEQSDKTASEGPKKADDVDEGYFDSSYIDLDKLVDTPAPSVDVSTETTPKQKTDATTATSDHEMLDILDRNFKTKLCLAAAVQTDDEAEPKRRKVSRACQITDEAVNTLNKKLVNLRNTMNKEVVERDAVAGKNVQLEKKCSQLDTERLSLLAQTETLQNECVKKMYDNDKLTQKIEQKECHIATLKETLLSRDKELHLLHKQPNTTAVDISKQINDYRELEMLRVDNIRLLHDNRALTTTLDSLSAQLCALRRISRNYDECKDSVILMNKRLAEDNSHLAANLNCVKKEFKTLNQAHHEAVEEMRLLRVNCKRNTPQRDTLDKQLPGDSVMDDNKLLVKQNNELRHTVEVLRVEVDSLHTELSNTRTAHIAFDRVLEEKCELQKQLQEVEDRNSDLWSRVAELRECCTEQADTSARQGHENNILSGENVELRKTNDTLQDKVESLKKSLDCEIVKNAEMAKKINELSSSLTAATMTIQDLQTTMEFLQVEHSFIESDVEKKNESISELEGQLEELKKSKHVLIAKCQGKLKEKTRKLNASRIKLGYALLEMRELNSHGSSSSFSDSTSD